MTSWDSRMTQPPGSDETAAELPESERKKQRIAYLTARGVRNGLPDVTFVLRAAEGVVVDRTQRYHLTIPLDTSDPSAGSTTRKPHGPATD
mmetsp:Transcript_5574/g.6021  ORF Transcript_5574/g.6021 Transcript_5574/m.6021 type:complete len:91 (-) Transcript_5574:126-398(-)